MNCLRFSPCQFLKSTCCCNTRCNTFSALSILILGLILNAALYSRMGYTSFAIGGGGVFIAILFVILRRDKIVILKRDKTKEMPPNCCLHKLLLLFKTPILWKGVDNVLEELGIQRRAQTLFIPEEWRFFGKKHGDNGFSYLFTNENLAPIGTLYFMKNESVCDVTFKLAQPFTPGPDESRREGLIFEMS